MGIAAGRYLLEKELAAGSLSAGEEAQRRLLCRRRSRAPAAFAGEEAQRRLFALGGQGESENNGGRTRLRRVARGSERYGGRGRCTLGKHLSLGWACESVS